MIVLGGEKSTVGGQTEDGDIVARFEMDSVSFRISPASINSGDYSMSVVKIMKHKTRLTRTCFRKQSKGRRDSVGG